MEPSRTFRTKPKINILQLLPTFDNSGPSNVIFDLAVSLNPEEFNVIICSMRRPSIEALERARRGGIKVVTLNMRSIFDFSAISKLRDVLIREKIDILHNTGFRSELYGGVAGRIAKCKRILTTIHHNPSKDVPLDYGFVVGSIINFLRRIFAFFCEDILIAVSKDAKRGLINNLHFREKDIKIIYNGINLDFLQSRTNHQTRQDILSEFGISSDKFIVGTVAALKPRKDISTFINTARIVIQDNSNIRFLIVGSGVLDNELKEQVKTLDLKNYVVFCGHQDNILDFLKTFDLMVLSSLTEGLPLVLLEAMAVRLPIVATQVGGTPELIDNDVTGILVPPKNPEALAKAIIKIYKDPNLASIMGENGHARFKEHFTADIMTRQYEKVYEGLLKK